MTGCKVGLSVGCDVPVLPEDVTVASYDFFFLRIPNDELFVWVVAGVVFVKIVTFSGATSCCPESNFAQSSDFHDDVRRVLPCDNIDFVAAFVCHSQMLIGCKFCFEYFSWDGTYDFFHWGCLLSGCCFSDFVDFVLHPFAPLLWGFCAVECLPGYGFPDAYGVVVASASVHFVGQKCHCKVGEMEAFAPSCHVVESVCVLPDEVYGHDVALVLHTFCNKGFVPCNVTDGAVVLSATAESGWEHDDVAIAAEGAFYYSRERACLFAYFIDGHTEWRKSLKVHKEVVDKVFYFALVVFSDNPSECYAIDGSEGMVADEGAESAVGGEVLSSFHIDCDSHVVDNASAEVNAYSSLSQIYVDELLVYNACQE